MGDDGSSIPPHDDGGGWKSLSCGSQGTPRAEQEGDRAGLKGWRWGPLGKGTQLRQGQVVGKPSCGPWSLPRQKGSLPTSKDTPVMEEATGVGQNGGMSGLPQWSIG